MPVRPATLAPSAPTQVAALPAARRIAVGEEHRDALERSRTRLVIGGALFALLFLAVGVRAADVTVLGPAEPRLPRAALSAEPARTDRADIVDRNGVLLATSLPGAALYANPRELRNSMPAEEAVALLTRALPGLDAEQTRERLGADRSFVYLRRFITPAEEERVTALGIPGIRMERAERRVYPLGRTAVHVLGGTDVDGKGIAGVEMSFDARLRQDPEPLALSIDVRVQDVLRETLGATIRRFDAIGGAGVIMDVRTGELLAMASLPDYDPARVADASEAERFNRITVGLYEPGSTFKLLTAAMALEARTVPLWGGYDASRPIQIGRFTINDFMGKRRWLSVPEIIVHSSNIGAARMAEAVGVQRHRQFVGSLGLLARTPVELPETAHPLAPGARSWREIHTMTISYGHGISVTPLHVTRMLAALSNGGVLVRPTLLRRETTQMFGERVVSPETSRTMRQLMRLVVTQGTARSAEVAGYFVAGKTGTAQKVGRRGYNENARISSFAGMFPAHEPRYAIYVMIDEPKGRRDTAGYATGGWVAAPAAGEIVTRIGPLLGMAPETTNAAAIAQALAMPLQPPRPAAAARATPAGRQATRSSAARPATQRPAAAQPANAQPAGRPAATRPASTRPASARPTGQPATTRPASAPNASLPAPAAERHLASF
ncbi:MAG: penicillin-binding protein 2 [Alphaproteobacteria bacterium]|nr:penicillin-binding protein 2 [Alphaproteobacteria bacterium]